MTRSFQLSARLHHRVMTSGSIECSGVIAMIALMQVDNYKIISYNSTMLTLNAYARRLGIGRATAYRWFRAGLLPARTIQVGPRRKILVDPDAPRESDAPVLEEGDR